MYANAEHNLERGKMLLALSGHPAWLDPKLWQSIDEPETLMDQLLLPPDQVRKLLPTSTRKDHYCDEYEK